MFPVEFYTFYTFFTEFAFLSVESEESEQFAISEKKRILFMIQINSKSTKNRQIHTCYQNF